MLEHGLHDWVSRFVQAGQRLNLQQRPFGLLEEVRAITEVVSWELLSPQLDGETHDPTCLSVRELHVSRLHLTHLCHLS